MQVWRNECSLVSQWQDAGTGAGGIVMFTRLPLCRPMPEKLAERLSVCWLSTDKSDKTPAQLASGL